MGRVPSATGPAPRYPSAGPPGASSATLDADELSRAFRVPDLPDRLAAVDERIAASLGRNGALLGSAAIRVAGSGGKRLRPLLAIISAALGDVFDDRVVACAAAVELVQVGSLVHDDILDRAATRRGRPTINAVEGVDHALLAGDYILARAAELASSVSGEAAGLVAQALGELCEGQVLELRDAFDPGRSVDAHLRSIQGKTAALFECSCRLGALCGRLSERDTTAVGRFGLAFGMGFQVLDDVLDLIGDAEQLGKPTGNDIDSGVYTLPVLTALDGSSGDELRAVLGRLPSDRAGQGRDADDPGRRAEVQHAMGVVLGSGSVSAALQVMDRYTDDARRAVAHLDQTAVGEGLAAFPRTYTTWALETFMDAQFLQVPLTAPG